MFDLVVSADKMAAFRAEWRIGVTAARNIFQTNTALDRGDEPEADGADEGDATGKKVVDHRQSRGRLGHKPRNRRALCVRRVAGRPRER